MHGRSFWYVWFDALAKIFKHGDHFVQAVYDKSGQFVREKTDAEAEAEIIAYLRSPAYLGRGAKARAKGQQVIRIQDVTDYARSIERFGPNSQVDQYIEQNTVLRHHSLEDKDTLNPNSITAEEILRIVNSEVYGTRNIHVFEPYDKQLEAIDKSVSYYINGGTDFLLDCVMRFGKCFTSYHIAKRLGARRILVITGRPKVKNGWRNDLDHVAFAGWEFIDSQTRAGVKFADDDDLFVSEQPADVEVIFASFQGSDRDNYESRLAHVAKQEIDLVIVDELHAYYSKSAFDFIMGLKCQRRLWVSGTPFVAYDSGQFMGTDDTYRFTLMDLQHARAQGHPRFKDFPIIQFWVAKYPDWSKSVNQHKFTTEQGLNMALLLSNNNGVTNYPTEVRWLLDNIQGSTNRKDSVIGLGPRETDGKSLPINPKHIWWSVPAGVDDSKQFGVAAATTLATELLQHPDLKKYAPLVVKGDATEDDVVRHQTQNANSSVISCRSLNTGTKFEPLDTVAFMRESIGAAEFWQTVGRPLHPMPGKTVINIILWSAELIVNMADAMVDIEVDNGNTGHQAQLEEFFSLMPCYLLGDGRAERMDSNKAYEMLDTTGSPEKCFKNRAMFAPNIRDLIELDPEFAASFPDMDKEDGNKPVVLNRSGAPAGKNKGVTRGQRTKQEENFIDECFDRIREFMRLTVSVQASCALHEDFHVRTLEDLKNAPDQPIDSVFGPGTKKLFEGLLERGWINQTQFDKTISKSYAVQIRNKV